MIQGKVSQSHTDMQGDQSIQMTLAILRGSDNTDMEVLR